MGNDKNRKLEAEKLEKRIAPGRLTYDVPPGEGTSGDDVSAPAAPAKELKKKHGGNQAGSRK